MQMKSKGISEPAAHAVHAAHTALARHAVLWSAIVSVSVLDNTFSRKLPWSPKVRLGALVATAASSHPDPVYLIYSDYTVLSH